MIDKKKIVKDEYLYIPDGLKRFCVPIDSVKLDPKNPRKNDRSVKELAEGIKTLLFRKPIVVDQDGIIRAGNTAFKSAKYLGMKMIPVAQSDFTDEELSVKYEIFDNKIGEKSGWDEEILKHLFMTDLSNLSGTGFTESDRNRLFKSDEIEKKRAEMVELGKKCGPSSLFDVSQGDIRTWKTDKKFDFIITDPPYPKEFLPLYEDLGRLAANVLKPQGLLVCLAGQFYFDEILKMVSKHLNFYWITSIQYKGIIAMVKRRQVIGKWKPVLVFSKCKPEDYRGKIFLDGFQCSTGKDVELHKWQQGVEYFDFIISHMCNPGQTILDPMCGSSTTGIAALKNGCYYTGLDIDEKNVEISRERLSVCELMDVNKQTNNRNFTTKKPGGSFKW